MEVVGISRFGVLGDPVVWKDGQYVPIAATRDRIVLCTLLLHRRRVVSVPELIEIVWPQSPPRSAPGQIHGCASRLRRHIGDAIVTTSAGYLVRADDADIDAYEFEARAAEAYRHIGAGELAAGAAELRRALDLWRGPALAGVDRPALAAWAAGLQEARLTAWDAYLDAMMQLGRHFEVLGELTSLVARHPLRERYREHLMLALYRAGRVSDALTVYRQARADLVRMLGVEPGPALTRLHQRMLRRDPALTVGPGIPAGPPRGDRPPAPPGRVDDPAPRLSAPRPGAPRAPQRHRPAQLPLDPPGFTGRTAEIARLDSLLAAAADDPDSVPVAVLSGTAGVGKTTLAVHWARHNASRFPDGQLYVNLHGFGPHPADTDGLTGVRILLDALGVPPTQVPALPSAQAATYRSLLDGRRLLILVDNARDPDQVRALLPGSPGCMVLVTSRDPLTGLVAAENAHPVHVDLMSAADARELFTRRIDPDRAAAEPEAVRAIVECCAFLPLALVIVAARATAHPPAPLTRLAAQLRDARERIDTLSTGDASTDMRAVLSWSYAMLGPDDARVFRTLGLLPDAALSVHAVASAAGLPVDRARTALLNLVRGYLADEVLPGRYGTHNVLSAYAQDLLRRDDGEAGQRRMYHRLFDHYLRTAIVADRLLSPHRVPMTPVDAQPGHVTTPLADRDQARTWLSEERANLLTAVQHALRLGLHDHTWQLARSIVDSLDWRGYWHDQLAVQEAALVAAQRTQNHGAEASIHRFLALAKSRLGASGEIDKHLARALELYEALGDTIRRANTHRNIAWVCDQRGDFAGALAHDRQALELFRAVGNKPGEGRCLNAMGWYSTQLGDHRAAVDLCTQALDVLVAADDREAQAATWDSLGYAHAGLGDHVQAAACYESAAGIYHTLGNGGAEAEALLSLVEAYRAAGRPELARTAGERALSTLDGLGEPAAERIRARLEALGYRVEGSRPSAPDTMGAR